MRRPQSIQLACHSRDYITRWPHLCLYLQLAESLLALLELQMAARQEELFAPVSR